MNCKIITRNTTGQEAKRKEHRNFNILGLLISVKAERLNQNANCDVRVYVPAQKPTMSNRLMNTVEFISDIGFYLNVDDTEVPGIPARVRLRC